MSSPASGSPYGAVRPSSIGAPRIPGHTGTRLGLALLAYMFTVTAIITLLPFEFARPAEWRVMMSLEPVDFIANILLFIPLGFFYRYALDEYRPSAFHVFCVAALVSGAIEVTQLFEIARVSSPIDVVANAFGASLGALAGDRVANAVRVEGRLVGWLALELPLMGLVYLLVPLLWINTLAAGTEVTRAVTVLLLGVFGASVLGGIQRYYFMTKRKADAGRTAGLAALWFVAGAIYSLPAHPVELVLGAAAVAALTWWLGGRNVRGVDYNRRFEVPVLRSAAPAYAAYLALITTAPLSVGIASWRLHLGFPAAIAEQIEILRLLELVAAFTLLGYMVAEFRGRAVLLYRDALPRLVCWGLGLACVVEGLRGFHGGQGASVVRGVILVAAALYGGWLYYLQRAHVMRILADNKARVVEGAAPAPAQ